MPNTVNSCFEQFRREVVDLDPAQERRRCWHWRILLFMRKYYHLHEEYLASLKK